MGGLVGGEKYRLVRSEDPKSRARRAEIEQANSVAIQQVLQDLFGIYVPSDLHRSWKTHCPFDFEHVDRGVEKTLRVYGSHSAYCFAMHGFLTPVRLVQIRSDTSALKAARQLAQRYGLAKRDHYSKRWAHLVVESATRVKDPGSPMHAVAALQAALEAVPGYLDRQFDTDVSEAMKQQLEGLEEVLSGNPQGGVREWFSSAVRQMTEVVGVTK